jgi:hypothetical protein
MTQKILLGTGVFTVGGTAIALTRGGGSFVVEREYRHIDADGDFGFVEGRQEIDRENAKLTVNGLDMFTVANMPKFYPATTVTAGAGETPTIDTMTSSLTIAAGDYVDVTWVGKTRDGKAVTITIENGLNLTPLEWNLEDKSEVVPVMEFTAHYAAAARTTPPWKVVFAR